MQNPVTRALLADGAPVSLRTITFGDEADLVRLHDDLSPQSLYFRFFSLSHQAVLPFIRRCIREEGIFSHSVLAEYHGQTVGMATYNLLQDSRIAEIALIVADRFHSKGIGTLLLEHLVSVARRNGVRTFEAEVLSENSPMLAVFHNVGLNAEVVRHGSSLTLHIPLTYDDRYLNAIALREQHADRASLRPLLEPAHVAVVGAGRRAQSVGHAIVRRLLDCGFTGDVYPINPHADRIEGLHCFADLKSIPVTPDLAIICVPAESVPEAVLQCAQRGVRTAVVVSGGLKRDGAGSTGERLRRIVTTYDMRLVGPNCLGIANTAIALDATFGPSLIGTGHVGVVTQSGGVGIAVTEMLRHAGLGVSTFVSTGDKYDVSSNDLLHWWSTDDNTRLAIVYVESFGNPRKFARLARNLALHKPLIAVKAGASEIAQRAAQSHTAATATPAVTRDALFGQAGVIAVDGLRECVETAALVQAQPLPHGARLGIISNAGGAGVIAADACARVGVIPADLAPATVEALRRVMPPGASLRNPVDTTAAIDKTDFLRAVEILAADPGIDSVLVMVTPVATSDVHQAFDQLTPPPDRTVLGVLLGQESNVRRVATIPVYCDPDAAVQALGHVVEYAAWRTNKVGCVPVLAGIDADPARLSIRSYLDSHPEGGWLEPGDISRIAQSYRLPALESALAFSESDVTFIVNRLGAPVAMKAVVPGLIHRSDRYGVAIDIPDARDARRQYRQFVHSFGRKLKSVQIQTMAPRGIELLVGVTQDPQFGPLVQIGAGGTTTDITADRTARLLPLTDLDAAHMLEQLRIYPLLRGFRGSPRLDIDTVLDTLHRVARLAQDNPEICELDINPLIVHADGCAAADIKMRLSPTQYKDPYLREVESMEEVV